MRKSTLKGGEYPMTPRQRKFCDEYLISGNATDAARKAGYSARTAKSIGQENLTKPDIRAYIDTKLEEISSAKTANAKEVLEYLTSVMRGESTSEVVVVEGVGDGCSEARTMNKAPDEKERLKAAELIGKRYGLFTDKIGVESAIPVVIENDLEPDDEADQG